MINQIDLTEVRKKEKKKTIIFSSIVGLAFLVLLTYLGYMSVTTSQILDKITK